VEPGIGFAFVATYPRPVVTGVKPRSGTTGGGTTVNIHGADFYNVRAVIKFGSVDATTFSVRDPNLITAVSPPGSGDANVTVTTLGGTSTADTPNTTFKYKTTTPTITGLTPTSGPTTGGTTLQVTGTGFQTGVTATTFDFGATRAISVDCTSSTRCDVVAPAGRAGTIDLRATVSKKKSKKTPADRYIYG
jgi:hypothetical protein